ncbi:GFA family protein [Lacimonas salitolerans]|uniref:GFA family protein n=1 Tax=Lacimonas salitolerans TaxID=1323750 RepID=A0ABW4ECC4_9RHOB
MKGRCYCGEVQYEVTGKPVMKAQCHCRECQYLSGGGPNFFMAVPNDGFRITKGTPRTFTRSDIPDARTRQFCGTCGTHLTTLLPSRPVTIVKIGTLDDPATDYGGPSLAIFMKDTQPFHMVADGLPCFQDLPPRA